MPSWTKTMCVCVCVCAVSMYVHMYVCMYVRINGPNVHVRTHTLILESLIESLKSGREPREVIQGCCNNCENDRGKGLRVGERGEEEEEEEENEEGEEEDQVEWSYLSCSPPLHGIDVQHPKDEIFGRR